MPDLTLIFDLPVDESQRRQARRMSKGHKADRLDAEDAAFHTRVRDAYLRIAAAEPNRVRVIDAAGSVQETQGQIMRIVMPFLESKQQADDSAQLKNLPPRTLI
jgi:dTMP kinase